MKNRRMMISDLIKTKISKRIRNYEISQKQIAEKGFPCHIWHFGIPWHYGTPLSWVMQYYLCQDWFYGIWSEIKRFNLVLILFQNCQIFNFFYIIGRFAWTWLKIAFLMRPQVSCPPSDTPWQIIRLWLIKIFIINASFTLWNNLRFGIFTSFSKIHH